MKRILLAIAAAAAAMLIAIIASAPPGVMSMTQAERKAAATLRATQDLQARNDRTARQLCALRLGIAANSEWSVKIEGATYVVQRGMCRMHRSAVE